MLRARSGGPVYKETEMDVLSDILDTLRFRSALYFTTEFRPPWGVAVPRYSNVARFHLVMDGACWVRVGNEKAADKLVTGDLVMIPHGAAHTLCDRPDGSTEDVGAIMQTHNLDEDGCLVYGGGSRDGAARLVCGHFEFDETDNFFVDAMPSKVVIRRGNSTVHSAIDSVLALVAAEARSGRDGSQFVLKRLTEILFIQSVRHWHDHEAKAEMGLLSAIADRHIGRSLRAVHAATQANWTVESMAREAGLSRTAFAERFRRLVGQSPMSYVTAWRMQRARLLLKESDFSIDRIAVEVGYQSPASFARVFRKITGQSPGAVRREQEDAHPQ